VVQLYVGRASSRVERPVRELRAFGRLALAAHARGTITLRVPVAELAYWDESTRAWTVEPGEYTIWAGSSSRALPLEATLRVRA
jgi:beta-glucosidase